MHSVDAAGDTRRSPAVINRREHLRGHLDNARGITLALLHRQGP